jgi:hypothetical protein
VERRPRLGRVTTFLLVTSALRQRRRVRRRSKPWDDDHLATRLDRLLYRSRDLLGPEHPTVTPLLILERHGAPANIRIGYLGTLTPASSRGRRLRTAAGRNATLGCVVETGSKLLLTTAGHIGATVGETLFSHASGWQGLSDGERLGEIVAATSSKSRDESIPTADGIDVCAAETTRLKRGGLKPVRVGNARSLSLFDPLEWNGGATGHKAGWVMREMKAVELKNVRFCNALIAEGPFSGAGKSGDSGAAAYNQAGDLVGHFVATAGYHKRSVGQAAVIQDAQSAIEYLESRVGSIVGVMRVAP